jgi:hypothetical protein
MSGYPGDITGAERRSALFTGGGHGLEASDDGARGISEQAWLNLLARVYPGLAGALSIASVIPSAVARLSGASMPHGSGGGGLGSHGIPWGSSNALTRSYADHPTVLASGSALHTRNATKLQPPQLSKTPPAQREPMKLDTKDNINALAKIITSEASNGNYAETFIGWFYRTQSDAPQRDRPDK